VGPRVGLDAVMRRKIPSLLQELNPDRPAHSQSLCGLSYRLIIIIIIRRRRRRTTTTTTTTITTTKIKITPQSFLRSY
jgi:hypothetical protein